MRIWDSPRNRFAGAVVVIVLLITIIIYGICIEDYPLVLGSDTDIYLGNKTSEVSIVYPVESSPELTIRLEPGQVVEVTITDAEGVIWDAVIKDGTVIEKTEWRGAGDD